VKINHKEINPDLNDRLLKDLLTKMLKIDPNQRINWNEYFQHDFFKKN
jgi:serine/threonine protein kinase